MIKIYTDGSCLSNPGNGGWAAIINNNGQILKISGSEKNTTNNKMELMAPIRALKKIDKDKKIEIYTDSQYVKLGIRSNRYTMFIDNLKVIKLQEEDETGSCEVSAAQNFLNLV